MVHSWAGGVFFDFLAFCFVLTLSMELSGCFVVFVSSGVRLARLCGTLAWASEILALCVCEIA